MLRNHRMVLGVAAFVALPLIQARAQYNYPYGQGYTGAGFGGWTSSVGGDVARGMGTFAAEEGTYQYDQAVANRINAATIGGINQSLWLAQQEANNRANYKRDRRTALTNASQATAHANARRVRDNPTKSDIESGAALNALLDLLSEPKVMSGSNLRQADAKLNSKLIREIPFRDATDAVTLTLSQLSEDKSWPVSLRDPQFDTQRQAFMKAVADALEEDENGDLSTATVRRVRQTVADLYRRVAQMIPTTRQPDHLQAMNYLKGLAGFSKMLEKANVAQVLAELNKIDQTTVGNLIAFMHSYNLRFGTAETPEQMTAYRELYPIMASTREKLVGKPEVEVNPSTPANPTAVGNRPVPGSPTAAGNPTVAGNPAAAPAQATFGSPSEIFYGMDPKYLYPSPDNNQNANPNANPPIKEPSLKVPGTPR